MTAEPSTIFIEVAYALPERAIVKAYRLSGPATVEDALAAAAADPDFSAVDLKGAPIGVHGQLARREQPLEDGDRVEIYRALTVDPKAARRARAKQSAGKGHRR